MASKIYLNLPGRVKMPALGLGTFTAQDPSELENALIEAVNLGYRHIDTATVYGNEDIIGRTLKKLMEDGKVKREELFVTTKLPSTGMEPEKVEACLKESLEKLQLEFVDLYLIHSPIGFKTMKGTEDSEFLPKCDHVGVWKAMEAQVRAGRTRTIGLSNFNIKQIENILKHATIKPANLQVEVQVYFQQTELISFCHKNNISVVAYGPLGNPGYNKFLSGMGAEEVSLPNILSNPAVLKIADKHLKSPAQVLLRFLMQLGIAAIPKSTNPVRLRENIDIFDFELDYDDMKTLKGLDVGEKARLFTMKFFKGIEDLEDYPFYKS